MKLAELAFACHIYDSTINYDSSYDSFRQDTAPQLDLNDRRHRLALLKWLNKWNCRQFARTYHHLASERIHTWYGQVGAWAVGVSEAGGPPVVALKNC